MIAFPGRFRNANRIKKRIRQIDRRSVCVWAVLFGYNTMKTT